jgi:DNA (cytosine-5)-methyltransferase 1
MDEMDSFPPVLVAENVTGLVSSAGGENYRILHENLARRGFKVGPVQLNAARWLPQSRPRVFVIAVREDIDIREMTASRPGWAHPPSLRKAADGLADLVWWDLPEPSGRKIGLKDVIDFDAPCMEGEKAERTLALIKPEHLRAAEKAVGKGVAVFKGPGTENRCWSFGSTVSPVVSGPPTAEAAGSFW